jgi:hypothetical protein
MFSLEHHTPGAFGPMHRAQGPGQKALTKKGRKSSQKRKEKKSNVQGGAKFD